jgi:hypothetical protein
LLDNSLLNRGEFFNNFVHFEIVLKLKMDIAQCHLRLSKTMQNYSE